MADPFKMQIEFSFRTRLGKLQDNIEPPPVSKKPIFSAKFFSTGFDSKIDRFWWSIFAPGPIPEFPDGLADSLRGLSWGPGVGSGPWYRVRAGRPVLSGLMLFKAGRGCFQGPLYRAGIGCRFSGVVRPENIIILFRRYYRPGGALYAYMLFKASIMPFKRFYCVLCIHVPIKG